jgi:thiamine-monophosphate kinase
VKRAFQRDAGIAALSEFELIKRFFTHRSANAVLGVGDDAAIVRPSRGKELVVSTDMLVSGRHFMPDADPKRLGHKSLAVNLSDMAAMGATPRWVTLSLALPQIDPAWVGAFARGFMTLARKHHVDLIGGDTTRGPLAICVQIMGEVPRGKALRRDGARAGDDVWVSGRIGDAAIALEASRRRIPVPAGDRVRCQRRLDAPTPRVELGIALRGIARSAIDVSDGLLADLGHICERSQVSAEIDWKRVPVSSIARQQPRLMQTVLAGGDDYELCFTVPAAKRAAAMAAARKARVRVTRIGRIARGLAARVRVLDGDGAEISITRAGFDHFRE